MTGEQMYTAYRTSMQRAEKLRGVHPGPRWKDLKPWLKTVWNRAAADLSAGQKADD